MIVKQDRFSALCINNKYEDFGSHTGFQWRSRNYSKLVVGEWYDYIKDDDRGVRLIDKDDYNSYKNGTWFDVKEEHMNIDLDKPNYHRNSFYCFFSTVSANRNKKLEELGI